MWAVLLPAFLGDGDQRLAECDEDSYRRGHDGHELAKTIAQCFLEALAMHFRADLYPAVRRLRQVLLDTSKPPIELPFEPMPFPFSKPREDDFSGPGGRGPITRVAVYCPLAKGRAGHRAIVAVAELGPNRVAGGSESERGVSSARSGGYLWRRERVAYMAVRLQLGGAGPSAIGWSGVGDSERTVGSLY